MGNINLNTTDGYVYLTPDIDLAYYYGNINLIQSNTSDNMKYVYIFKVDVDETKLKPDMDNLRINHIENQKDIITREESIKFCRTVAVSEDVNIKDMEYIKLPGTMNNIESKDNLNIVRKLSKASFNDLDVDAIMKDILCRWSWQKV